MDLKAELKTELSLDRILEALQIEPATNVAIRAFIQKYGNNPPSLPRRDPLARQITRFFFAVRSKHLRDLVDQWLETGLREDGSESTRERQLVGRPFGLFFDYVGRNPPVALVSPQGEVVVKMGNLPTGPEQPTDPFSGAQSDALRYFSVIILGDLRQRLCKCRYAPCGRYFRLDKPRAIYRHGTFCSREHLQLARALVCTREGRDTAKVKLIDLAARQLLRWRISGPDWQQDIRRKVRLATILSTVITEDPMLYTYRGHVKSNWVTRNQAGIEQRRLESSRK